MSFAGSNPVKKTDVNPVKDIDADPVKNTGANLDEKI
jgi:hypothetical protein